MDMDKEEFLRSEPAVILAKSESDADVPAWISQEQKDLFNSLSDEEKRRIWEYDLLSRFDP